MEKYEKKIKLYSDYGDEFGSVEYVDHMGTDLTFANAARVSFGKHKEVFDLNDEKLLRYMMKHKHSSPFEHASITFRFVVPLFVRGQHHRHRTWSYNEISRRYTDFNIMFYNPTVFRTQHTSNRQASNTNELIDPVVKVMRWEEAPKTRTQKVKEYISGIEFKNKVKVEHRVVASELLRENMTRTMELYESLLESGVCREQARMVLPQNMYVEYYGTVNFSNLLKFDSLRDHEGAQEEIRRVSRACMEIAADLFPVSTALYQEMKNETND